MKNWKKKELLLLIALLIAMSVTACGKKKDKEAGRRGNQSGRLL